MFETLKCLYYILYNYVEKKVYILYTLSLILLVDLESLTQNFGDIHILILRYLPILLFNVTNQKSP